MQVQIGAGLIQKVDGLVGKIAVGDIALGEHDRLPRDLRRDLHAVEQLIVMRNAPQNGDSLVNARLGHGHGLEAALQRGVLFDIFAVLGEGRCADDLNFPAGKRRLKDVRRAHGALRVARAHEIMHLVNDENDIAAGLDLRDQALHAALELPAELGSGNQ